MSTLRSSPGTEAMGLSCGRSLQPFGRCLPQGKGYRSSESQEPGVKARLCARGCCALWPPLPPLLLTCSPAPRPFRGAPPAFSSPQVMGVLDAMPSSNLKPENEGGPAGRGGWRGGAGRDSAPAAPAPAAPLRSSLPCMLERCPEQ